MRRTLLRALLVVVVLAAGVAGARAAEPPPPGPHEPPSIDHEWVRFRVLCVKVGLCERLRGDFESIPPPTTTTSPPPATTSAPVVTAAPAPVVVAAGVEQWRDLVAAYFPADQVDQALCTMAGESGGNPYALNESSLAVGLMQIHWPTWGDFYGVSVEDLYDPATNMAIAVDIWAGYGWGAWSAAC